MGLIEVGAVAVEMGDGVGGVPIDGRVTSAGLGENGAGWACACATGVLLGVEVSIIGASNGESSSGGGGGGISSAFGEKVKRGG